MALFWRNKTILAKTEASYGVDAAPVAANAVLARDISFTPMAGTDVERNLELPYFGSQGSIPTGLHAKITMKVELAPSGTAGIAPAWGPLLRACGVAETITADTDVVYNPITNDPESLTIHFENDGTLFRMLGTRGNAKFMISAQEIPYIEFEFTGLYTNPTAGAAAVPNFNAWADPVTATNANTPVATVTLIDLVAKKFELDLGNQVEPRFLIGRETIEITGKSETASMLVEAEELGYYDPYSEAAAAELRPVTLQHGTLAGARSRFRIQNAQIQRVQSLEIDQGIVHWPLNFVPRTGDGNDQWTLTLY